MTPEQLCHNPENPCGACKERPPHECQQTLFCYICGKQLLSAEDKKSYAISFTCATCAERTVVKVEFQERLCL